MQINKLIDTINRAYITSEYVRAPDVYYYMDRVIDDINKNLQTKFPLFSEWVDFVERWNKLFPEYPKDRTTYDVIPNKYLRSVVALGTALYFFSNDEEGELIAQDYQQKYNMEMFYMVRDYHSQVPDMFRDDDGGYIDFAYEREWGV